MARNRWRQFGLAGVVAFGLMTTGLCAGAQSPAHVPDGQNTQPAATGQNAVATEASPTGIVGTWQGTLHIPKTEQHPQIDLRLVFKISKTAEGALQAVWYSIDQGGQSLPIGTVRFQDGVLKFTITVVPRSYEGKMSTDGKSIAGTWMEGSTPIPLTLELANADTAWAIPEQPKPMAADADPSFEVATIKATKPDEQRKLFRVLPNAEFITINTTLADLIKFAYALHEKQVIGGPDWVTSTKFDIEAKPDTPGIPNEEQLKSMLRKLLADRFQLRFHRDKRELSAYVLSVTKTGPKMTKDADQPNNGLPSMFFRGPGVLPVHNATMGEFANLMQSTILDRPVVDQTGLDGRWDFMLKWTPDESQFARTGITVAPPNEASDAPSLFTAIQEQIGLKLDAAKTPVEVLMLDHVDQPSPN